MSLTDRFQDWIRPAARLAIAVSIFGCILLILLVWRLPALTEARARAEPAAATWPKPPSLQEPDWAAVLRAHGGGAPAENSPLADRFRLAGTFFSYGETIEDQRKAIVDDLRSGVQHILSEGEDMDGVRVVRVFRDRIILREGATEAQLWLSFSDLDSNNATDHAAAGGSSDTNAAGISTWGTEDADRFGLRRVGENRWVFNRERLLDYYQELMDEPERLVQTFDSLKPLYDENGKITGYQLGVEGESDFFHAVGLQENDIVRGVNSIPMTNRRRAEYFIHEFVNNRANAFVLDIEHNGEPRKLIYQMR